MKDIEIRELTLEDLAHKDSGFFLALRELVKSDEGLNYKTAMDIFYKRQYSGVRTLVATIDDEVIGTASLIIEPKFLHGGSLIGHIEEVAVLEKYQRTGIGRMLMTEIIKVAKEAGCYKLLLNCEESKVEFYKKLGFFTILGMRLNLYGE